MEYITKSPEETKEFGRKIAAYLMENHDLDSARILALVGDLGAGKTTFVQGLSEGLGIETRVISPTFILMRTYRLDTSKIQHPRSRISNLYHIDLYRLEENIETEMTNLGIRDLMKSPENIIVVEWADKASEYFPENTVWIKFNVENDIHKISVEGLTI